MPRTKHVFIFGLFLLFAFFFYAISLSRYYSVQLFYYDFGIFAQIIWQLSRFHAPIINHVSLGEIIFLGDHFNPSLVFLAPLFWITSDIRILLLEQALVTALSGFVLYHIARKVNITTITALLIAVSFLLFAGTENPLVSDWHPEPTAGLLLLVFFYLYFFTKKRWLYLLVALIFIGFKESNPISLIFLLLTLFIVLPKKRKETAALMGISLSITLILTKLVIPAFTQGRYLYAPVLAASTQDLLAVFANSEKFHLVFLSLVSFTFVPLLSVPFLIPIVGELLIRIFPLHSSFENFTLGLHHNVYLGIFLALGVIFSWQRLTSFFPKNKERFVTIGFFIVVLFVSRKITNVPINLVINPVFWQSLHPRKELFDAFSKVPKKGAIMAQNNFLPYLLARDERVYTLEKMYSYSPDIILFDLSEGQNPNNFYPAAWGRLIGKEEDLRLHDTQYKRVDVGNTNIHLYLKQK